MAVQMVVKVVVATHATDRVKGLVMQAAPLVTVVTLVAELVMVPVGTPVITRAKTHVPIIAVGKIRGHNILQIDPIQSYC